MAQTMKYSKMLTYLLMLEALCWVVPQTVFAVGTCTATSCDAPVASCSNPKPTGTDNCGGSCSGDPLVITCNAPKASCQDPNPTGTTNCGAPCSSSPYEVKTCSAPKATCANPNPTGTT